MVDADVNINAEYLPNPEVTHYEQMAPEFVNSPGIIKFTDKGVIRIDSTNLDKGTVTVQKLPAEQKMFMGHVGDALDDRYENVTPSRISNIVGKMYTMAQIYPRLDESLYFFENTEEGRVKEFNVLRKTYGEVRSAPMLNRVTDVMNRLQDGIGTIDKTVHDKPYAFFIANSDSINAFCGANRVMAVFKGMLNDLQENDDELAAVLAHEMAHGQNQHAVDSMGSNALSSLGMYMLQGNVDGFVMDTLVNQVNKVGIDKVNERQADDLSFHYVVASGYNPGAPAAFWQRSLDRSSNFVVKGVHEFENVYNPDTHPMDEERLNNFSKKLTDYSNGHVTVYRGSVKIDGEEVVRPGHIYSDEKKIHKSDWERSYLVAGNLATICRDGIDKGDFYAENNKVMFDGKEVFSCEKTDRPVEEIVEKLNKAKERVLSSNNENYNAISLSENASYLQFDSRGNLVNHNHLDSERVDASRSQFLSNLSKVSENINKINSNLSDYDKGKEAGLCLVKLLEDKSAVDFFNSVKQQAERNSQPLFKGVSRYYESMKDGNNISDDNIHLKLFTYSLPLLSDLHLKGGNDSLNRINNMNIDNFKDDYENDDDDFAGLVGEFKKLQHNSDYNRGIMQAFKENPKALENLNTIFKIENDMLNEVESLRFNIHGKKIQNAKEMTKNLKKMVKDYSKIKAKTDAFFDKLDSIDLEKNEIACVDELSKQATKINSYMLSLSDEIHENRQNYENFSASYSNFNSEHSKKFFDKQVSEYEKIKKDFETVKVDTDEYLVQKLDEIKSRNKNSKKDAGKEFVKGLKSSKEKSASLPKFEFQNPKKKRLSLGKDNKVLEREVEVKKPNFKGNKRGSYEKNDNGR